MGFGLLYRIGIEWPGCLGSSGLKNVLPFECVSRWYVRHRTCGIVLVYVALASMLAIPILVARVPLGVDTLNHLARIHVRAHISADPDLGRLFEVRTGIIPYLGMDLLLTPLARVLPTLMVGRIYILALVWGLVGAVVILQRVFLSRVGSGPATAGMIAYNGLIAWGLINYVLGLILALLAFAAWHAQRTRPWLVRLVLFSGASTVLYLTHLFAVVLYAVMIASYELFSRAHPLRTPPRNSVVLVGQFAPVLFLAGSMATRLHGMDDTFRYVAVAKLLALESPFLFRGAGGGFDTGLLTAGFSGVSLIVMIRRGWLTWPSTLTGPMLVLLALTVALPFTIFGAALIDYRFPVAMACLALAGLKVTLPAQTRACLVGTMALLTIVHVADVAAVTYRCDGQYSELRKAFGTLPRGTELTVVLERTEPTPGVACSDLPIYDHIAQLITIERSGYAPDFFARATSVGPRGDRLADMDAASAATFSAGSATGYVLWIHLGRRRPVPSGFVPLWRGSFFDLWAVTHAS
jgi:hypothetical protein